MAIAESMLDPREWVIEEAFAMKPVDFGDPDEGFTRYVEKVARSRWGDAWQRWLNKYGIGTTKPLMEVWYGRRTGLGA
jgi:hypothetical protein